MIEITHSQILDNGFPIADIEWRSNASVTEIELAQDVYDVDDAYEAGHRDGQEVGEELAVEDNRTFAAGELGDLIDQVLQMSDSDLDILPEHIHEATASAVLDAVLDLITEHRERLSS